MTNKAPDHEEGVYGSVCPEAFQPESELYIPRLLGPDFFRFLSGFISDPMANPFFAKEWRRNRNRLPWFGKNWVLYAGLIGVLSMGVAIGALIGVRALPSVNLQRLALLGFFFLPAAGAGICAFFAGLGGGAGISNPHVLEELRLTPLGPQEIVFGFLTGGLLPIAYPALMLLPGWLLLLADLCLRDPLGPGFNEMLVVSMSFWFFPNAASSVLLSSSISSAITFGERGTMTLLRAFGAWLIVSLMLAYGAFFGFLTTLSAGGSSVLAPLIFFGMPVIVAIKLVMAGAFLNHMAHRLAALELAERD